MNKRGWDTQRSREHHNGIQLSYSLNVLELAKLPRRGESGRRRGTQVVYYTRFPKTKKTSGNVMVFYGLVITVHNLLVDPLTPSHLDTMITSISQWLYTPLVTLATSKVTPFDYYQLGLLLHYFTNLIIYTWPVCMVTYGINTWDQREHV